MYVCLCVPVTCGEARGWTPPPPASRWQWTGTGRSRPVALRLPPPADTTFGHIDTVEECGERGGGGEGGGGGAAYLVCERVRVQHVRVCVRVRR